MKFILVLCLVATQAFGFDSITVGGGGLYNSSDYDSSELDDESALSLQVGVVAKKNISDSLDFRTGAFFQRKSFSASAGSVDIEGNYDYLSIPLTVAYGLDSVDLIGGLSAGILVGDDCEASGFDTCNLEDTETFVPSLILGLGLDINEKFVGEAYLEKTLSDVADGARMTSLVLNILFKI